MELQVFHLRHLVILCRLIYLSINRSIHLPTYLSLFTYLSLYLSVYLSIHPIPSHPISSHPIPSHPIQSYPIYLCMCVCVCVFHLSHFLPSHRDMVPGWPCVHRVGPAAALGIQRPGTAIGHRSLHDTQGAVGSIEVTQW